jgi:hypothetical protein
LLGSGAAAAIALAAAGLFYEFSPDAARADPQYRFTMLDDEDRAIVAALAPVMLHGALPNDPMAQSEAISQIVRGVDIAMSGLPLAARAQLRELFGILRFPLSRIFVAGIWHPWHDANRAEITRFLESWRYSRFAQLRSAYDALHQLLMASWYGIPNAWTAIGYSGPPAIG